MRIRKAAEILSDDTAWDAWFTRMTKNGPASPYTRFANKIEPLRYKYCLLSMGIVSSADWDAECGRLGISYRRKYIGEDGHTPIPGFTTPDRNARSRRMFLTELYFEDDRNDQLWVSTHELGRKYVDNFGMAHDNDGTFDDINIWEDLVSYLNDDLKHPPK
jgi:hypothetical protein